MWMCMRRNNAAADQRTHLQMTDPQGERAGMDRQLLLLLLILSSESAVSASDDDTGQSFIIAFPEKIAFYHPVSPKNKILITAVYDGTEIEITEHLEPSDILSTTSDTLNAGETKEHTCDSRTELQKLPNSFKSVRITSSKNITVQAVHLKDTTVQTALVISTDKHGTEFFIPPTPTIQHTTSPQSIVTTDVTERNPFKLVVINADQPNTVTVGAEVSSLEPFQVSQLWVQQGSSQRSVKAERPVAVLYGHPCAMSYNCSCGMLYTTLPPASTKKLTYYIPAPLAIEGETFVLLSDEGTSEESSFNPDSPLVQTSGTAILYRPGLLLTLVPDTQFASCFVVFSLEDATNFVVIMVDKDHTDGLHIKDGPPASPEWKEVKKSRYVSAMFELDEGQTIIWHATSTMAVYFVGRMGENKWFGHPAPVISKSTDFRGCALTPEVVEIGSVASGWRESLQYCKNRSLELVSFADAKLQTQIYRTLVQMNGARLLIVWIGMRRSSVTGEWYWINGDPVDATNWDDGEPGSVHDGQCAIVSLESGKDFGWRDEDCCKAVHPVCYSGPKLMPL